MDAINVWVPWAKPIPLIRRLLPLAAPRHLSWLFAPAPSYSSSTLPFDLQLLPPRHFPTQHFPTLSLQSSELLQLCIPTGHSKPPSTAYFLSTLLAAPKLTFCSVNTPDYSPLGVLCPCCSFCREHSFHMTGIVSILSSFMYHLLTEDSLSFLTTAVLSFPLSCLSHL